jgi:hypothetical protein
MCEHISTGSRSRGPPNGLLAFSIVRCTLSRDSADKAYHYPSYTLIYTAILLQAKLNVHASTLLEFTTVYEPKERNAPLYSRVGMHGQTSFLRESFSRYMYIVAFRHSEHSLHGAGHTTCTL